jgi:hypothetical protein
VLTGFIKSQTQLLLELKPTAATNLTSCGPQAREGGLCPFCPLALLMRGACRPGLYTYVYSVADNAGNAAEEVVIHEKVFANR